MAKGGSVLDSRRVDLRQRHLCLGHLRVRLARPLENVLDVLKNYDFPPALGFPLGFVPSLKKEKRWEPEVKNKQSTERESLET